MKKRKNPKPYNSLYMLYGCEDRDSYLRMLSDVFWVDLGTVKEYAEHFGPKGDFDDLLKTLEDVADCNK